MDIRDILIKGSLRMCKSRLHLKISFDWFESKTVRLWMQVTAITHCVLFSTLVNSMSWVTATAAALTTDLIGEPAKSLCQATVTFFPLPVVFRTPACTCPFHLIHYCSTAKYVFIHIPLRISEFEIPSSKPNLFTCSWGHYSYRQLLLSVCTCKSVFTPVRWSWVHSHRRCPQRPDWRRGQILLWWAAWCEPATGHLDQTSLTHQHLSPGPHVAAHASAEEGGKRKMAETKV